MIRNKKFLDTESMYKTIIEAYKVAESYLGPNGKSLVKKQDFESSVNTVLRLECGQVGTALAEACKIIDHKDHGLYAMLGYTLMFCDGEWVPRSLKRKHDDHGKDDDGHVTQTDMPESKRCRRLFENLSHRHHSMVAEHVKYNTSTTTSTEVVESLLEKVDTVFKNHICSKCGQLEPKMRGHRCLANESNREDGASDEEDGVDVGLPDTIEDDSSSIEDDDDKDSDYEPLSEDNSNNEDCVSITEDNSNAEDDVRNPQLSVNDVYTDSDSSINWSLTDSDKGDQGESFNIANTTTAIAEATTSNIAETATNNETIAETTTNGETTTAVHGTLNGFYSAADALSKIPTTTTDTYGSPTSPAEVPLSSDTDMIPIIPVESIKTELEDARPDPRCFPNDVDMRLGQSNQPNQDGLRPFGYYTSTSLATTTSIDGPLSFTGCLTTSASNPPETVSRPYSDNPDLNDDPTDNSDLNNPTTPWPWSDSPYSPDLRQQMFSPLPSSQDISLPPSTTITKIYDRNRRTYVSAPSNDSDYFDDYLGPHTPGSNCKRCLINPISYHDVHVADDDIPSYSPAPPAQAPPAQVGQGPYSDISSPPYSNPTPPAYYQFVVVSPVSNQPTKVDFGGYTIQDLESSGKTLAELTADTLAKTEQFLKTNPTVDWKCAKWELDKRCHVCEEYEKICKYIETERSLSNITDIEAAFLMALAVMPHAPEYKYIYGRLPDDSPDHTSPEFLESNIHMKRFLDARKTLLDKLEAATGCDLRRTVCDNLLSNEVCLYTKDLFASFACGFVDKDNRKLIASMYEAMVTPKHTSNVITRWNGYTGKTSFFPTLDEASKRVFRLKNVKQKFNLWCRVQQRRILDKIAEVFDKRANPLQDLMDTLEPRNGVKMDFQRYMLIIFRQICKELKTITAASGVAFGSFVHKYGTSSTIWGKRNAGDTAGWSDIDLNDIPVDHPMSYHYGRK
jgi:hypothetical protein